MVRKDNAPFRRTYAHTSFFHVIAFCYDIFHSIEPEKPFQFSLNRNRLEHAWLINLIPLNSLGK